MFYLNTNMLAACAEIAQERNPRAYLRGVHINIFKDGTVKYAATDGVMVFLCWDKSGGRVVDPKKAGFIVPCKDATKIGKDKNKYLYVDKAEYRQGDEGKTSYVIGNRRVTEIFGFQSDIGLLIPSETSGVPALFDPERIMSLRVAYNKLNGIKKSAKAKEPINILQNGYHAAIVATKSNENAIAAIMPIKGNLELGGNAVETNGITGRVIEAKRNFIGKT